MEKKATSNVAALEPLGGSAPEPRWPYDEVVDAAPVTPAPAAPSGDVPTSRMGREERRTEPPLTALEETVMVAELKRTTPNFAKISVSLDVEQREQLYQTALIRLRVSESAVMGAGLRLFLALSDAEQRKMVAGQGRRRKGAARPDAGR